VRPGAVVKIALGVARKQRFARDKLMRTCREIGIGVVPTITLPIGCIHLRVTGTNGMDSPCVFG